MGALADAPDVLARGIWLGPSLTDAATGQPMPDEPLLCEKAREVVEQGKMPNRQPDRLWGRPGASVACTVCNLQVYKDEMELEVEFVRDGASPNFDVYQLHVRS
jgi:hypothetical protein